MSIAVHHGDCREIIPTLGVTVDAVVTDPPYHLSATVQRFGGPKGSGHGNKFSDPGTMSRVNESGAAGATARLARGFMGCQWDGGDLAFRPETWATIGEALRPGGFLVAFGGTRTYHRMTSAIEDAGFVIQDCLMFLFATGFPKRRDMLKPAYEPIVLAYKPGGKRTMQVDECRTEGREQEQEQEQGDYAGSNVQVVGPRIGGKIYPQSLGRWPANICHDGSDEVIAAFPEEAGGGYGKRGGKGHFGSYETGTMEPVGFGDSGSAARFFFSAKAGAQDRWGSRHPTVKPVELMKWLVALVCPPGGLVLDPFAGSGTTAVAALGTGRSAILIEREDQYVADIRERLAFYEGEGRHSLASKARRRAPEALGGLFATAPAPIEYDETADALGSYNAAIEAIGNSVKAGAPVPESLLSKRAKG